MVGMADAPLVTVTIPAASHEPVYFFVGAFADPTSLGVFYALSAEGDPTPAPGVFQDATWVTDPLWPNQAPIAETPTSPARRGRWLARGDVGDGSDFELVAGTRYLVWARVQVSVSEVPVMLGGIIDAI
jgi:hypothetical protein